LRARRRKIFRRRFFIAVAAIAATAFESVRAKTKT
jgi:hypothetical protein